MASRAEAVRAGFARRLLEFCRKHEPIGRSFGAIVAAMEQIAFGECSGVRFHVVLF
jgi:hypothetical protein